MVCCRVCIIYSRQQITVDENSFEHSSNEIITDVKLQEIKLNSIFLMERNINCIERTLMPRWDIKFLKYGNTKQWIVGVSQKLM